MSTEPNKVMLADPSVPQVTLAGKRWPVPAFSIKINSLVSPLIVKHMLAFIPLAGKQETDEEATLRILVKLTAERWKDLSDIVYWALWHGHRGLTREEFDELIIQPAELVSAYLTCGAQAGIFRPAKPGESAPPLAVTPATETAISPTGAG